jgi:hypothetical protein
MRQAYATAPVMFSENPDGIAAQITSIVSFVGLMLGRVWNGHLQRAGERRVEAEQVRDTLRDHHERPAPGRRARRSWRASSATTPPNRLHPGCAMNLGACHRVLTIRNEKAIIGLQCR